MWPRPAPAQPGPPPSTPQQRRKDPSLISESDLTNHRLIDSVFIANIGTGSGSMVLAGITVHKQ
jgi:hypothetical protein